MFTHFQKNLTIITVFLFIFTAFHVEPWSHYGKMSLFFSIFIIAVTLAYRYQTDPYFALRYSPTKHLSRFIGKLAWTPIPKYLRKPLYYLWCLYYKANMEEFIGRFEDYPTFHHFFTRKIFERPIDPNPNSISGFADGVITHLIEVTSDQAIDIKNIRYHIGELFTGSRDFKFEPEAIKELKHKQENKLFLCKTFLAPGNYHHYHSPADFLIRARNHISGFVRPVDVKYELKWTNIYEENERVVLVGEWKYGFMAINLIAAGAEVGSISLKFEPELETNKPFNEKMPLWEVKEYPDGNPIPAKEKEVAEILKSRSQGIQLGKGHEIGHFNYGSSIVLIFEAPPNFQWKVRENYVIRYGECIGIVE